MANKIQGVGTERGFSLVELMIAVALGAALLFGVIQIFDSNKQSSRLQHAFVEVQEAGRIASELLVREIRMADYWGCLRDTGEINDMLDPDSDVHNKYSYVDADGVMGANDVEESAADIGNIAVRSDTDVLTIKGATRLNGFAIGGATETGDSTINITRGEATIGIGSVILLSDCNSGELFANTQDTTPANAVLGHSLDVVTPISNIDSQLSRDYGDDDGAALYAPFTKTFFIGKNTVDGWSLYSYDITSVDADELVRNVDDLQLLYGIDSDSNGSADLFTEAPNSEQMNKALSIRAQISAHSSVKGTQPSLLTREFSATANIRNRSL